MFLDRAIERLVKPKNKKSEKSVEEPKENGKEEFQKSISQHQQAHSKRVNLSEGIVKHIRNNGNGTGQQVAAEG